MLLRALSRWLLKSSGNGGSTTSLDNLFQCFTVLMVKKFFTISSLVQPVISIFACYLLLFCYGSLKTSLLQPIEAQPLLMGHVQQPRDHPEPPHNLLQLINKPCIRGPQIGCISDVVQGMPSEIITLLILLALLLLIHPRRLSASAARTHRWLTFSLLSAKTSRSCSAKLLSSQAVLKLYSDRGFSCCSSPAGLCMSPCGFPEGSCWSIPLSCLCPFE